MHLGRRYIIAYRTLCAYLPLHRLWIWWAFCTGIAAAIVSIARAAAASKNPRAFATPSQVVFSPLLLLHHTDAIAMPSSRKVASILNYQEGSVGKIYTTAIDFLKGQLNDHSLG